MNKRAASFSIFYGEHYDRVRRSLYAAFRDAQVAQDAAQEAFTRAYVHWRRVADMDRPDGWVYVVAFRVAQRRVRADSRTDLQASAVDIADEVVTRAVIRDAIARLPQRQRLAIVLRYLADLPVADVAEAMGCATGTVKSTLHAALTRLQIGLDGVEEVELDAT